MTVELVPRVGEDPHEDVKFALRNEGRGIARYVGAMCEFTGDVTIAATNSGWSNNTNLNQGRPVVSYADNVGVIHAVPITSSIGSATIKRSAKGTALSLHLRWYCKGMMERTFDGLVTPNELSG